MFDTSKFICEVKKWPVIYDSRRSDYTNTEKKTQAWEKICSYMVPEWKNLSGKQKFVQEKILRGKWRNLKDYYIKNTKKGRGSYLHSEELNFLDPIIEFKESKNNSYAIYYKIDSKEKQTNNPVPEIYQEFVPESDPDGFIEENALEKTVNVSRERGVISELEEDYDKLFLLSLTPILKAVPEEKKLDIKIRMQQLLADACNPST